MTCSAITTAHMPSAKIESDSAAISRRYSRNSERCEHAPATGVAHRLVELDCVLTQ